MVLSGVVECDEMYLGGRETNKHETKKTKGTQGGAKTKTPVFGMTMVWKTEDVDRETGEVKTKTHTYEVAKKVADKVESELRDVCFDQRPPASVVAQNARLSIPEDPERRFIKLR